MYSFENLNKNKRRINKRTTEKTSVVLLRTRCLRSFDLRFLKFPQEYLTLCGNFNFISNNSNIRWYVRTKKGFFPSAITNSHFERFFISFNIFNIVFDKGICRREFSVFGVSEILTCLPFILPSRQVLETVKIPFSKSISSHESASNSPIRKPEYKQSTIPRYLSF